MKKFIVRFKSEEDLIAFNKRNKLDLDKSVKSYSFYNGERKYKKTSHIARLEKDVNRCKLEWFEMPEFKCEDQEPYAKIDFHFAETEDVLEKAAEKFDQNITKRTKSIWFPKLATAGWYSNMIAIGGESKTRFPIYVVSKGRADCCKTSQYLALMNVPHYIVVEEFEYEIYKKHNNSEYVTVIILDETYKDNYDTFWEMPERKTGPGPARNFAWDHSIKNGFTHHWVMDDNVGEPDGFFYFHNNIKIKCRTGAIFRACEDFHTRYKNLAISGLNYSKFCVMTTKYPPFVRNTRIYSFLLIRNDIPYRWRGRYNEDTDLSLNVLKGGWCTVQFNAFLAGKTTTQVMKGGNTDEFYAEEGTYNKSMMLVEMHPDVTRLVYKFSRIHHEVNYRVFKKTELELEDGVERNYVTNNYGIHIIHVEKDDIKKDRSFLEEKYCK